jgi:hypothetical protein
VQKPGEEQYDVKVESGNWEGVRKTTNTEFFLHA